MTDTIFALATAPGRSAVAVVRLSGPAVRDTLAALGARRLKPRSASLRSLVDGAGETLDRALVLWFPGPASYTGEDAAELHLHGGPAVVDAVMLALGRLGLRLAEPGEFTRRAFTNGKMDLGQAEGVADLVDAESRAQARQAMAQLDGALGDRYRRWRGALIGILARLEAAVDFPDEDLPAEVQAQALEPIIRLTDELSSALADGVRGRQVRDGYRVALVGAVNAGKSSLFNALVGRDAAIVTAVPGATRDVIEASIDLNGFRVLIADMAGLRESPDEVEAEGVRRARAWAEAADLRIWVVDRATQDDSWKEPLTLIRRTDIGLLNKADLATSIGGARAVVAAGEIGLGLVDGELATGGADGLRVLLTQRVTQDLSGSDFPATTRARHVVHLRAAVGHLDRARAMLAEPELAAEDVRLATRALAMVTGSIGVEDVLGDIFASFCIGK